MTSLCTCQKKCPSGHITEGQTTYMNKTKKPFTILILFSTIFSRGLDSGNFRELASAIKSEAYLKFLKFKSLIQLFRKQMGKQSKKWYLHRLLI